MARPLLSWLAPALADLDPLLTLPAPLASLSRPRCNCFAPEVTDFDPLVSLRAPLCALSRPSARPCTAAPACVSELPALPPCCWTRSEAFFESGSLRNRDEDVNTPPMVRYTAPAATRATSQTPIVHHGCRAQASDMRCVNPPLRPFRPLPSLTTAPAGLRRGKAQITIVNANMICSMPATPPARNRPRRGAHRTERDQTPEEVCPGGPRQKWRLTT